MKNQDCDLCFYKFAHFDQDGKELPGHCYMFKVRVEGCKKFKNDIIINGESYRFINPLNEPDLDKGANKPLEIEK